MASQKAWTPEEQHLLVQIVTDCMKKFSKLNWAFISEAFNENSSYGRNIKQCKQKWICFNSQKMEKGFTKHQRTQIDSNLFFELFHEYGRKWSFLSQYFPGQNQKSLKNWFFCCLRKGLRHLNYYNRYVRTDKSYKVYQKDFLTKLISAGDGSSTAQNLIIYTEQVPKLSKSIQQKLIKCSMEEPQSQKEQQKDITELYRNLEQDCIKFCHVCKFRKSKNTKNKSEAFLTYIRQQKSSANMQSDINEETQAKIKIEQKSEEFGPKMETPENLVLETELPFREKIKKEQEVFHQWVFYMPILFVPNAFPKVESQDN